MISTLQICARSYRVRNVTKAIVDHTNNLLGMDFSCIKSSIKSVLNLFRLYFLQFHCQKYRATIFNRL